MTNLAKDAGIFKEHKVSVGEMLTQQTHHGKTKVWYG